MSVRLALPAGTIPPAELDSYVAALARETHRWQDSVAHDPARRRFTALVREEDLEVWLVCWMPGQDTGWHDHGNSAGAVAVVSGLVREERLWGLRMRTEALHRSGQRFSFTPEVVHRVSHAGPAPAVTLHAYSPALRLTSAYRPDAAGNWSRIAVDQDAELRPL